MEQTSNLPPTQQQWSHSTITIQQLRHALDDPNITSIEADILMGAIKADTQGAATAVECSPVPIMSHPPQYTSELSAKRFLTSTTCNPAFPNHPKLRKHLKLDFKDLESVKPTLKILQEINADPAGKTIFLNADLIAGPGRTSEDVVVIPEEFLSICLDFIPNNKETNMAFSLGFKVDVVSIFGHTHEEIATMADLVDKFDLLRKSAGVVLAINARLLSKHYAPFDAFLKQYPSSQLLVWTGSGEPPISTQKAAKIRQHFEKEGTITRIGFDCQVSRKISLVYHVSMNHSICLNPTHCHIFNSIAHNIWV